MKDSTRENLSYFGLYKRLLTVKKDIPAEKVSFGDHKDQHFLYFEPEKVIRDKVIIWVPEGLLLCRPGNREGGLPLRIARIQAVA